MLEMEHVYAQYGSVQVIWDACFKAIKGQLTAIIGPNGAGKTTMTKIIAGLMHPSSGEIRFEGERVDQLQPFNIVDRGMSLVPEGRRLFPRMTVRENLLLGAYTPRARSQAEDSLESILESFAILRDKLKRRAETLSGGEQQILAIARGLMSKPKLLILDEPSLGLAPKLISELMRIVKHLVENEVTVLLVEQNIQETLESADRAYVLEEGKIALDGTGDELLKNDHVKRAYLGI